MASQLLADVFADRGPLQVLDVGAGNPRTLEFLQPYATKVFFLDLEQHRDDLARPFGAYPGTLFDVCLFWDFLHHSCPNELLRLNYALLPHVYSGTRAHAIVRFDGRAKFNVAAMDQLEVAPNGRSRPDNWSYVDFASNFDAFRVTQDVLTPDGHHELLLEAD